MTGAESREEAMASLPHESGKIPHVAAQDAEPGHSRDEAVATVAYLKWMSSVDTNGFPIHFGHIRVD